MYFPMYFLPVSIRPGTLRRSQLRNKEGDYSPSRVGKVLESYVSDVGQRSL
jgi:hypothetical protein